MTIAQSVDKKLLFTEERSYFSPQTPDRLKLLLDKARGEKSEQAREAQLVSAARNWKQEPDAHISLYKHYFVTGQYRLAEKSVFMAIHQGALRLGISHNYWQWSSSTADWTKRSGPERLCLFSLKALGVIRLRLAEVTKSAKVLTKLLELDPSNEIGGDAFLNIALAIIEED